MLTSYLDLIHVANGSTPGLGPVKQRGSPACCFAPPFLEGISWAPAALGLLGPRTDTAALETEGLPCMCMFSSEHLKYSAISP